MYVIFQDNLLLQFDTVYTVHLADIKFGESECNENC